jgi:hypothetical protein
LHCWNNTAARLAYRNAAVGAAGDAAIAAVGEDAIVAERNAGFVVFVFFNAAIVFVLLVVFAAAIGVSVSDAIDFNVDLALSSFV